MAQSNCTEPGATGLPVTIGQSIPARCRPCWTHWYSNRQPAFWMTPELPGAYGLDEPRLQVILKDSAGSVLLDARFGADTGDGNQLYWKSAAESQVKVVSKDVFDVFDVTEDELLDPLPPAATTSP